MNRIFETEFGSHVYGTNLPSSDRDIKGIYLPSAEDILLQRTQHTVLQNTKKDDHAKNGPDDVDKEFFSIQRFLQLLLEGQTGALDMLFTPSKHWTHYTDDWQFILLNKEKFLHSGTSAFSGYCKTQAAKYGIKGSRMAAVRSILELLRVCLPSYKLGLYWEALHEWAKDREHCTFVTIKNPAGVEEEYLSVCDRKLNKHVTVKHALEVFKRIFDQYGERAKMAETNQGIDWKACMHAVRVCTEAEELLLTSNITFPRPDASLLLQIRKGELPYKQVAELIENGLTELEKAKEKTVLPPEPDTAYVEAMIQDFHASIVKNA